jgi:hypothetical protein
VDKSQEQKKLLAITFCWDAGTAKSVRSGATRSRYLLFKGKKEREEGGVHTYQGVSVPHLITGNTSGCAKPF